MTKKLKIIINIPGSGRSAARETAVIYALNQEGLLSDKPDLQEVIHVIRLDGLGGTPLPSLSDPLERLTTLGKNLGQFITSIGLDENVTVAKNEIEKLIKAAQASEVKVALIGYSRGGLQSVAIANELQKIKSYSGAAIQCKLLLIDPAGGVIDHLTKSIHKYEYHPMPLHAQSIFIFLNDINPSIEAKSLKELYPTEPTIEQMVSFILPGMFHMHGESRVVTEPDIESPLCFLVHCTRLFLQTFMNDASIASQDLVNTEAGKAIINYIIHHKEEIKQINTHGPIAPWRRRAQDFTNVKAAADVKRKTTAVTALHNFLHDQLYSIIYLK